MVMPIEQMIAPAPDWAGETWAQRIDAAASLLFLHGYIPQSIRSKITQKIETQFRDALDQGRIIAKAPAKP